MELTKSKEEIVVKTTSSLFPGTTIRKTIVEKRTVLDLTAMAEAVKNTPIKNISEILSLNFVKKFVETEVVETTTVEKIDG